MPPSGRKASSSLSPKDLFGDEPSRSKSTRSGGTRRSAKQEGGGPAITLTVESGSHAGKQITLTGTGTIGRSSKCELCLRGAPGVSRRHAIIELRGVTYFIKDAESRNGIVVNGIEIADETALLNGDLIELSDEHIRVRLTAQPAEPAPASTERIERPLGSDLLETRPEDAATSGSERSRRATLGLEQAAALLADGDESASAPPRRGKQEAPFDEAPVPAPVLGSMGIRPPPLPLDPAGPPSLPELPASALEPLLPPPGGAPPPLLEPLGVPQSAAALPSLSPPPAYEEEPAYLAPSSSVAASEVAPPKRRGSALMFLVGSAVGLTLALLAVGAWDALMNDGRLRDELHAKANAHLRPHGLSLPTFDELFARWSGESAPQAPAPTSDGGPATGTSPAPPAILEPITVTAPGAGRVVTVTVAAGASVKAGDNLAVITVGSKANFEKKDKLDQEIQKTEKLAKKRGKRGAKAKKQLKALKSEARDLQRGLRTDVIKAPRAATVKAVSVKPKDYVDAGGALLELTPSP